MQSRLVSVAVFVFELEEVVTAGVEHRLRLRFVVVEGIAGDGRVMEVGVLVEPQGDRLFAFAFVVVFALLVVVFGLLLGESQGHGGTGLVVAQAQA